MFTISLEDCSALKSGESTISLFELCLVSGVSRETFRKTFKEENPDVKGITAVSYYIHTSTKYGFFRSQEYWANIHVDADKTIVSKTIVSSSFILLLP